MAEIDWNSKSYRDVEHEKVDVTKIDDRIREECTAELQQQRAPKKISDTAPLNDKDLRVLAECTNTKRDAVEKEVVDEKAAKILGDLDRRLRNAALDGKMSMVVMPVKDFSPTSATDPLAGKVMEGLRQRNLTAKYEPRARDNQKDPYTHNIVAYWEKWKL
jgi:hypothetical protein